MKKKKIKASVWANKFVIKNMHFSESFKIDFHRSQNKRLIYLHKSNYISSLL